MLNASPHHPATYVLFTNPFYLNEICFVFFRISFFTTQFRTTTTVRNVREFGAHRYYIFDVYLDGIFTMCTKSMHLFVLGRFKVSLAKDITQFQIKFSHRYSSRLELELSALQSNSHSKRDTIFGN